MEDTEAAVHMTSLEVLCLLEPMVQHSVVLAAALAVTVGLTVVDTLGN